MSSISSPANTLQGRTVLVTGATSGIGRVTAQQLARLGARVYLAGRSQSASEALAREISAQVGRDAARWIPLDLAQLASVRDCADRFLALDEPLHILVNNAGLAGARGATRDGFEMAFGVNHLGHFLLTDLLLDRIKASGPARIVTVASRAHRHARSIDWDDLRRPTRSLTGIREYGVSKLANILFSAELARRLEGSPVSTYCLHPGVVDTRIWRAVPALLRPLVKLRGLLTPEEGARTTLYCAVACPQSESGLYYADARRCLPSALAQDVDLARTLWERSAAWTASGTAPGSAVPG
jgi:NAD(P)-dependent dehydrogenase (short-subunit alcohol dehydrogenase family)